MLTSAVSPACTYSTVSTPPGSSQPVPVGVQTTSTRRSNPPTREFSSAIQLAAERPPRNPGQRRLGSVAGVSVHGVSDLLAGRSQRQKIFPPPTDAVPGNQRVRAATPQGILRLLDPVVDQLVEL